MTPVMAALWSVSALLGVPLLAALTWRWFAARRLVYGACLGICLVVFAVALAYLVDAASAPSLLRLPLGLPWIGAHFRIDALAAFFLVVANLGGAAASLFAIGYGQHEKAPGRVLPFYAAFLAGMNLVVLADDAFTFLVAWEFMSLSSWALVMAHHQDPENRRAGYIYIVMASFGTLVSVARVRIARRRKRRIRIRRDARLARRSAWIGLDPSPAGCRFEGWTRAVTRLAAARPSRRAQPRLGVDERGDDQGRGLRLHPHHLRPQRSAGLVVEHRRDRRSPASPVCSAC